MLNDIKQVNNSLLVSHEELTNNPQVTIDKILNFSGLRTDKIDISKNWKIHEKYSVITNMNEISFKNLTNNEKNIIIEEAGYL